MAESTYHPRHQLLGGLMSAAQSLMLSKTAYVFRPSPRPFLALTRCLTLRYVTAASSAPSVSQSPLSPPTGLLYPQGLTESVSGFGGPRHLARLCLPPRRFALAQVANLGSGFLQVPHWLPRGSTSPASASVTGRREFLRAPLPSPTCSPLPGPWLDLHQLAD